ncbi:MAG: hypothetical protein J0I21_14050 [Alphaproteobacteria bacterium]|nr:hypothetical protein [Alphaproteobacteria bacterium]
MAEHVPDFQQPQTEAVQQALRQLHDHASVADLLFLERWEMAPVPGTAAALRIQQIRRACPGLAEQVRAEIAGARARMAATPR